METNSILYKLLVNRGLESQEDILEFLSDKPKKTYNPALLSDLEAGVDLILSETSRGSKICVYGDYDADGITSTALMMSVLSHLTDSSNLSYYIPSRFDEGYGLNMDAVKLIKDRGVDFIITVDCGSVSKDEAAYAESLGMKILVTDHHTITDTQADCLLINPKKPGDAYPFKDLSGCGVAFKLASELQKKAGLPKSVLSEVLDLVAIGTIGDIMPLTDENRTMVKFGLRALNTNPRQGLRMLIDRADLKNGEITSDNVGFVIVPHLNASGRLKDASQCVALLLEKEVTDNVTAIVDDLIFKNRERRRIQGETHDRAIEILTEEVGEMPDESNVPGFIMLRLDDAHEGITGIVAGKIKDEYNRPVVIVTKSGEDGFLKGTGRSIPGVDLYELIKPHEAMLAKFGGHKGACGFTIEASLYDAFRREILFDMAKLTVENPEIFKNELKADMDINCSEITTELAANLELLQPYGNGNRRPLFRINDVDIADVHYMGSDNRHARFTAIDEYGRVQCLIFNHEDVFQKLGEADCIDLLGKVELSEWQGKQRVQFKVDKIIYR